MHRLTALLGSPLRLIGSGLGSGGRPIADGIQFISLRRLAAPRYQNWSRLGERDFQAEPLGDASVVKPSGIRGFENTS